MTQLESDHLLEGVGMKFRYLPIVALSLVGLAALPASASSDLPRQKTVAKAKDMQRCPGFGYGFFRIPETLTCLKLGMDIVYENKLDFVQNELNLQTLRLPTPAFPNGAVPVLFVAKQNLWATANHDLSMFDLEFTALTVTPTDDGPLVTFADGRNGVDVTLANSRLSSLPSNNFFLDQGWVSWAGLTAGKHQSYFDFTSPGYGFFGGYSSLTKTGLLAYSKSFDNLVSVTASLEDPTSRQQVDGVISAVGPSRWPDVVGQVRFAPKNALFQLSGALHQNVDTTAFNCCQAPVRSKEGFAVLAGMELRAHWSDYFGPGAKGMYGRLMISGAYANGAVSYLGMPFFASDYVADADGTLHLSQGASALISYEHLWTPFVKSTLTFSGYDVRSSSGLASLTAVSPTVTQQTQFTSGLFNFRYHVRGWAAQFGNEIAPESGLIFGAEVNYTHDTAKAVYSGVAANPVTVGIWSGAAYVKRLF